MDGEAADPLHIVAEATRRASRPAGESREGAALFGGGLGNPPTSIRFASRQGSRRTSGVGTGASRRRVGAPLRMPEPELLIDQAEMDGEAADPLHIVAEATRRASRPAGESREGAALFGGGLGEPPNLYPLRFPPGKQADLRRRVGRPLRTPEPELLVDQAEMDGEAADPPRFRIGAEATRRASRRRESPERAQPSLVGAWGTPQPLSASLPAREAGGPPESGPVHPDAGSGRPYECRSCSLIRLKWMANQRTRPDSASGPKPREGLPAGGRVQRGRSPLWWGLGGTPQPLSASLPAREAGGPQESVIGATNR